MWRLFLTVFFPFVVSLQTRDRIGSGGPVVDCRGLVENEGWVVFCPEDAHLFSTGTEWLPAQIESTLFELPKDQFHSSSLFNHQYLVSTFGPVWKNNKGLNFLLCKMIMILPIHTYVACVKSAEK